jgi:hypothetical protein
MKVLSPRSRSCEPGSNTTSSRREHGEKCRSEGLKRSQSLLLIEDGNNIDSTLPRRLKSTGDCSIGLLLWTGETLDTSADKQIDWRLLNFCNTFSKNRRYFRDHHNSGPRSKRGTPDSWAVSNSRLSRSHVRFLTFVHNRWPFFYTTLEMGHNKSFTAPPGCFTDSIQVTLCMKKFKACKESGDYQLTSHGRQRVNDGNPIRRAEAAVLQLRSRRVALLMNFRSQPEDV